MKDDLRKEFISKFEFDTLGSKVSKIEQEIKEITITL